MRLASLAGESGAPTGMRSFAWPLTRIKMFASRDADSLSSKGGEGEEGAPREGEGSGNPKAEGRRPKAERRPKPEGRSHAQLNPPNTLNDAKGADLMRVPASR